MNKKKINLFNFLAKKDLSGKTLLFYLKRDYLLYLMLVPVITYFIIFKYIPMYGVTIAFKDYNIFAGISGSEWVGFDVFKRTFKEPFFWLSIKNTLLLNILTLLVTFPMSILISIFLNEVRHKNFKKITQSLIYLPYFVSWVVVSGLVVNLFSLNNGSINNILSLFGISEIPFLVDNQWWIVVYVLANLWKDMGWGTIIYLAALSGVDESLYEAAYIDGATRLKRIWYITLPCIKPTIVIMFILSISKMMSIGLDAPLLLQNDKVIEVAEVISTYVYKMGINKLQYDFATAVGLFQSVINIILLLGANAVAKVMGEDGIF